MRIQSLAGDWNFRQTGTDEWLPAVVPGGVHTDLLALGRIPDPFVGDNEKRVQWVAESDWVYQQIFRCSSEILTQEQILLVCDGLDTLATVVLNGQELGRTNNMFRKYEWDVKSFLNAQGDNTLTISFLRQCNMQRNSRLSAPWLAYRRPSLADRICAKRPASLAGIGARSCRPSGSGKTFGWKDTARRAFPKFTCVRSMLRGR